MANNRRRIANKWSSWLDNDRGLLNFLSGIIEEIESETWVKCRNRQVGLVVGDLRTINEHDLANELCAGIDSYNSQTELA